MRLYCVRKSVNMLLVVLVATALNIIIAVTGMQNGFIGQVAAAPGLRVLSSSPEYSTSEYRMTVEDMKVKVQGGHVRMVRTWIDGEWVWNRRWATLKILEGTGPTDGLVNIGAAGGGGGVVVYLNATNLPTVMTRNGALYVWEKRDEWRFFAHHIFDKHRLYRREFNKRIEVYEDIYTWSDRLGNSMRYAGDVVDSDPGKKWAPVLYPTSYSDANGNEVRIHRDSSHRVTSVSQFGKTIVTYEYNDKGDLIALRDYSGREVRYEYGEEGELTGVRDVTGQLWTYDYINKQLTGYTDPTGHNVRLSINSSGMLVYQLGDDGIGKSYKYSYGRGKDRYYQRTVDSTGLRVEKWYNSKGHLVRQDINGEKILEVDIILSNNSTNVRKLMQRLERGVTLNSAGGGGISVPTVIRYEKPEPVYIKQSIRTDIRGNKTNYYYDQWKNIIKVVHPDGGEEHSSYAANFNRPTRHVNDSGVITEYRYDARQNLIELIEAKDLPEERRTLYEYDSHGNITKLTEVGDEKTPTSIRTFTYDEYGNAITATDGEGNTSEFSYDVIGNVLTRKDARGKLWIDKYDAAGSVVEQTDPDGRTLGYEYDAAGRLTKIIAADNSETRIEYEGRLLTSLIRPSQKGTPQEANADQTGSEQTNDAPTTGYKTRFKYDKAGRPTQLIDPTGRRFQTFYDAYGRIAQSVDGNDKKINYQYDLFQLSSITYPTYEQAFAYDNMNALTRTVLKTENELQERVWQIDRNKRTTTYTDANANSSSIAMDGLGRVKKVIQSSGHEIVYSYDDRDNLLSVTDQEGRTTRYEYDKNDRLIAEIKPHDNEKTTYQYDATNNLTEITSATGDRTVFGYSAAGLLTTTEYFPASAITPKKTVNYTYDASGLVASYDDGETSARYSYDANSQLTEVTINYGPFSKTWSYSYYPNGLKKSYTNPEGISYQYEYDGNGQLISINIPNEGYYTVAAYQWRAPTLITMPGGSLQEYKYDGLLRLNERSYTDPGENQQQYASYTYDNESNITSIAARTDQLAALEKTQYQYNNVYRLTGVDNPEHITDEYFSYDGVGNRLNQGETPQTAPSTGTPTVWQYNANNQLIKDDTATYEYDKNGSLIAKHVSAGQSIVTTRYEYNEEQRLIRITEGTENHQIAQYSYDPFGRRIKKIVEGVTTYYLYNQEGLAAEYDGTGQLIRSYHFQPDGIWSTNPIFMYQDGEYYYYDNDHLGTPKALYNSSGRLVWLAKHTAFGKASVLVEEVVQNLRFPGQYYDGETGLHYNYFRYYDPDLGRYLRADPIGLAGGVNVFGYVRGNPIVRTDIIGLLELSKIADVKVSMGWQVGFGAKLPGKSNFSVDGDINFGSLNYSIRDGESVRQSFGGGISGPGFSAGVATSREDSEFHPARSMYEFLMLPQLSLRGQQFTDTEYGASVHSLDTSGTLSATIKFVIGISIEIDFNELGRQLNFGGALYDFLHGCP